MIKKQTEANRDLKLHERIRTKENMIEEEDINLGRFCELAAADKMNVNSLS